MISLAKKKFVSPISIENSFTNEFMGDYESTMELFKFTDDHFHIEWVIDDLDIVEGIGIWCNNKKVTEYDGVFELPLQAIELLKENGFDTSEVE